MSLFMLLFPVGMAVLVPAVAGADPARWRTLLRLLLALTIVTITGWSSWWLVTGEPLRSWWLWLVYPVLLLLAILVTNLKRADPAVEPPELTRSRGVSRTASLGVRRSADLGVPGWAWWTLVAVAFACLGATSARLFFAFDGRGEFIRAWSGLLMAALGLAEAVLFACIVRRILPGEPRPLDPGGSTGLTDGYDRLSRSRAQGFFVFGATMSLVFGAGGAAMAWAGEPFLRAMMYIGIAAGVTLGLAGSVFGAWCSIRAMRLQNQRIELTRAEPACPDR